LAITRAIVEAHGGSIAVASDGPEQGATVTIRLPLQ
jgi:signal transduction histidine kinase